MICGIYVVIVFRRWRKKGPWGNRNEGHLATAPPLFVRWHQTIKTIHTFKRKYRERAPLHTVNLCDHASVSTGYVKLHNT